MTLIFHRHLSGQTRLGIFTNLWPTALCRLDRATVGRYLALHVGTWRLEVLS